MTKTVSVRRPAVAGRFYPADEDLLRRDVHSFLRDAASRCISRHPKALIVPHAGYQYSGPVAASGYAQLTHVHETIRRVVLLGPSHHVAFRGMAFPEFDTFVTPLGSVPIDAATLDAVRDLPQVVIGDEPHNREHSLEVHLPFLQCVLDSFSLVPFCVGSASAVDVAEVLSVLWGGSETLIVVSSDLSHYHDYETARELDQQTSAMIEGCQTDNLSGSRACGYVGICGLLTVARTHRLTVRTVDLRNSGDTAGPRSQVVGYGAYVIE
ncbi:MAG: AmmeMemoRadiSam system protein B [Planctomycetaceae bacterium]